MTSIGLCWIRRDLRLHDHAALSQCTLENDVVHIVFIFDDAILDPIKAKASSDKRVQFICESVIEINQALVAKGGSLWIRYGNPVDEIPKLAQELGADRLYFNRDYSPYAMRRDRLVSDRVIGEGRDVFSFKDHVVFEPTEIVKSDDTPYRVFTPYSRAWISELGGATQLPTFPVILNRLGHGDRPDALSDTASLLKFVGFEPDPTLFPGGTMEGLRRLGVFEEVISLYGTDREYPSRDGTSTLSVYLRHGCTSIRDLVNVALNHPSPGGQKWLGELIWREFYQAIFYFSPWVNDRPFQERFRGLILPTSEDYLACFKAGTTGFPLIDAAMRCLNQTGWMHNRLRMVVASFVTKILLVDWKRGERYFSFKLIDYELQSNNGGWQWAAGFGCDAAPYFRIFNPTTQSQTYDPDGRFIRQFCPELRTLNSQQIHCPSSAKLLPESFKLGRDYPYPIVDYAVQRKKALAIYGSYRPD